LEAETFVSIMNSSADEPMASYIGVGISYRGVGGVSDLEEGIGPLSAATVDGLVIWRPKTVACVANVKGLNQ
jgi:hypothetical protein